LRQWFFPSLHFSISRMGLLLKACWGEELTCVKGSGCRVYVFGKAADRGWFCCWLGDRLQWGFMVYSSVLCSGRISWVLAM
jgi:hypothetical protein